ncbi:MAG: N-acetylglucosamine kinase [Longimicrobiales bacterium]
MKGFGGSVLGTPGAGTTPDGMVVGVDGGGTGCRALIVALEGREVAKTEGPPALVDPADPTVAADAIANTVRRAAEEADAALPLLALWAGLAGAGRAGEREAVEITLRSRGLARIVGVGTDVEGAHRDAFGGGPGVLLVVGTGSMVWGRDPEGREFRVGGWGGMLGDEGSGYWVGLRGLRVVARAADGRGPETTLTETFLRSLHLPEPQALIPWVASATKGEIGALAPAVLKAGLAGDPGASEVLNEALEELLAHLEVARSRWPAGAGPIPMALVGGLVEEGAGLREGLEKLVAGVGGRLVPHPVVPVRGAGSLALEMARTLPT